jgi:hypothetical protein
VAFVSQSRVWIADKGADSTWRAEPLPLDVPADRPQWLVAAPSDTGDTQRAELVMSAWYEPREEDLRRPYPEDLPWVSLAIGIETDLALWDGAALHRLTFTPKNEFLADTSTGDRLLFEREGMLFEAALERSTDGVRLGPETALTPGRDARYTPDGENILFVRGHESDPLGIWRQGYRGGDDSEIYHLDLASRTVTQLTDTPDNDECPVPLDNAGRRFMVCRERSEGSSYRPWIVEVITAKKHRVRRLPMPDGPWPIVSPAVRWLRPAPANRHPIFALVAGDTSLALEVWAEANGELITTRGEVQPKQLALPAAERIPIRLAETPLPPELAEHQLEQRDAHKFTLAMARAISSSLLARRQWKAIPAVDRRRLQRAVGAAASEPERIELVMRLMGRCGLPGFDYWPRLGELPESGHRAHYGWVMNESTLPWVRDLRGRDLSMASPWGPKSRPADWALRMCSDRQGPGVVLIDERTAGKAEVIAAGYRAGGCAILVGRTTAGLAMMVERHVIPLSGDSTRMAVITVPDGPVRISPGLVVGPEGVVPNRFVRVGASEEEWQAAVEAAREQLLK